MTPKVTLRVITKASAQRHEFLEIKAEQTRDSFEHLFGRDTTVVFNVALVGWSDLQRPGELAQALPRRDSASRITSPRVLFARSFAMFAV